MGSMRHDILVHDIKGRKSTDYVADAKKHREMGKANREAWEADAKALTSDWQAVGDALADVLGSKPPKR